MTASNLDKYGRFKKLPNAQSEDETRFVNFIRSYLICLLEIRNLQRIRKLIILFIFSVYLLAVVFIWVTMGFGYEDNISTINSKVIVINCKYLNLRQDYNAKSKVLAIIPNGSVLKFLKSTSPDGNWLYVEYKNIKGWCYFLYLEEKLTINQFK